MEKHPFQKLRFRSEVISVETKVFAFVVFWWTVAMKHTVVPSSFLRGIPPQNAKKSKLPFRRSQSGAPMEKRRASARLLRGACEEGKTNTTSLKAEWIRKTRRLSGHSVLSGPSVT